MVCKNEGHANGVASTTGTHERNGTTGGPEKRGFMRPPADYLRADSSTIESLGECWHMICSCHDSSCAGEGHDNDLLMT